MKEVNAAFDNKKTTLFLQTKAIVCNRHSTFLSKGNDLMNFAVFVDLSNKNSPLKSIADANIIPLTFTMASVFK